MSAIILGIIPREPRFTNYQLKKLSNSFITFAHLVLGSSVLKLFGGDTEVRLDASSLTVITLAVLGSIILWMIGIWIAGFVKED